MNLHIIMYKLCLLSMTPTCTQRLIESQSIQHYMNIAHYDIRIVTFMNTLRKDLLSVRVKKNNGAQFKIAILMSFFLFWIRYFRFLKISHKL